MGCSSLLCVSLPPSLTSASIHHRARWGSFPHHPLDPSDCIRHFYPWYVLQHPSLIQPASISAKTFVGSLSLCTKTTNSSVRYHPHPTANTDPGRAIQAGLNEYKFDIVLVLCFVATIASLCDWLWLGAAIIPGYAIIKIWTKFIAPWIFAEGAKEATEEDTKEQERAQRRRERKRMKRMR